MKNETPNKVSLEQLYQQRKANYKLPDAVREQLQKQALAAKPKKWTRWQIVVPVAFASLMTVVLIQPTTKEFKAEKTFAPMTQSVPMPSESLLLFEADEELALEVEQADDDAAYNDLVADNAEAAPATQPLAKMASPASQTGIASESVARSGADAPIQIDSPLTLKVREGAKGLFENCQGEEIRLEATTELTGWVLATLVNSRWQLEPLESELEACAKK
jgi:hypothetical protein